jgi:hypothetical protein
MHHSALLNRDSHYSITDPSPECIFSSFNGKRVSESLEESLRIPRTGVIARESHRDLYLEMIFS